MLRNYPIVNFFRQPLPMWIFILFLLGVVLFEWHHAAYSSLWDFFKYAIGLFIGGMITYVVQVRLKAKEEKRVFLNTAITVLRTLRH